MCGKEKVKTSFYPSGGPCKECFSKYQRKRYAQNRESILAKRRKYDNAHKEEKNAYHKEYYNQHKQALADYGRDWMLRNRTIKSIDKLNLDQLRDKYFDEIRRFAIKAEVFEEGLNRLGFLKTI